jgi:hypothetical protein
MRTDWVHDYETLVNLFVGVFINARSEDTEIFAIHTLRDDRQELIDFLEQNQLKKEWHISFNGLGFDSQITEFILKNKQDILDATPEHAANLIYKKAQDVIDRSSKNEFQEFSPRDLSIQQLDVYKLNHWDNPAKRSSLKWIEYTTDWDNIQDMPIPHGRRIETLKEINEVIQYCINDVQATKHIMKFSKKQISLRNKLSKEYNIDLYSASEPRIAKELFLHYLSKETKISKYELKQLRTHRDEIKFQDIILDYVKFETATFQNLQKKFSQVVLNPSETKNGFKYTVRYKGVTTDFGLGGVHGANIPGVYESNNEMIIISSDVVSYYPNLAIKNKWSPAHLPKEVFCTQYEWFFNERKKIPKSDPRNYVFKIILNSSYGLSNDENSFLYDPEFTMRITVNGQLSLMMLYEMIMERIPGAVPLLQNTDGLETMIPKKYMDQYYEICEEWEEITQLSLEHDTYKKLILRDVNNYIALTTYKEVDKEKFDAVKAESPHYKFLEHQGKYYYAATKCKGAFEFLDLALHKNKSYKIIPETIYNYFIHGIDPEKYLKSSKNIFDFCAGKKILGDWKFYAEYPNKREELQKTIRYYVSNSGAKLVKENFTDGRRTLLEAGPWYQTVYLKHTAIPFNKYDINYTYYLKKINDEINKLSPKTTQLNLF